MAIDYLSLLLYPMKANKVTRIIKVFFNFKLIWNDSSFWFCFGHSLQRLASSCKLTYPA